MQLAYVYYDKNRGNPVFLNTNGPEPMALFGGYFCAAAIDTEGGIIPVTNSLFYPPKNEVKAIYLPFGEKASNAACMNDSFVALSESGQVFELKEDELTFCAISELSEKKSSTSLGYNFTALQFPAIIESSYVDLVHVGLLVLEKKWEE